MIVSVSLGFAALLLVPPTVAEAADVTPVGPDAPTALDITFGCEATQTPNLLVPVEGFDEVYPAGTAATTFDFGTIDFADVALFTDCTPYDVADLECFEVMAIVIPPATEPVLQVLPHELDDDYCGGGPSIRPIGSEPGSTITTSGPTAIDVTFACAPDQTPRLLIPSEGFDEVYPAGTTGTTFDFGTIDFADVAVFIDCTPYDIADVECFAIIAVVTPPATEPVLEPVRYDATDSYCASYAPISDPVTTLGRRSESHVRLAGTDVSRDHADITSEGGRFVLEHDLRYDGDWPLNTHGGQLGMGQGGSAGGLSHVIDSLTQIQGRAGDRQLAKADKAYVTGVGGLMASNVGLVLEGA